MFFTVYLKLKLNVFLEQENIPFLHFCWGRVSICYVHPPSFDDASCSLHTSIYQFVLSKCFAEMQVTSIILKSKHIFPVFSHPNPLETKRRKQNQIKKEDQESQKLNYELNGRNHTKVVHLFGRYTQGKIPWWNVCELQPDFQQLIPHAELNSMFIKFMSSVQVILLRLQWRASLE